MISYMILAPNEMKAEPDERKSAKVCLETIQLDSELYRIGHTKARKQKWHQTVKSLRKQKAAHTNPPISLKSTTARRFIFFFSLND